MWRSSQRMIQKGRVEAQGRIYGPCSCSASSSAKNDGMWTTTPEPMTPVHFWFTRPAKEGADELPASLTGGLPPRQGRYGKARRPGIEASMTTTRTAGEEMERICTSFGGGGTHTSFRCALGLWGRRSCVPRCCSQRNARRCRS